MIRVLMVIGFLAAGLPAHAARKANNAKHLTPAEAVEKMTLPDGFNVTVFAAEPDIGEAIAFCFDDRGRLWTLENGSYVNRRSHKADKRTNRIRIFEDTDGDGVADKKKTFIDNLDFASGLAIGHGGVYVGMPPELIFIPDRNSDDRPDGDHEILLDGWGVHDRHETLNSFIWGPDGWLYGCHGVFTRSRVGRPGTPEKKRHFIDGGIWRFHPGHKTFEVFARGLSNPWGVDFNDVGDAFATCCVIPHLFHIVQGGSYDKQGKRYVNRQIYDRIMTIRDHKHRSAHGGARFYMADAFPEKYRNQLFMCNLHQRQVLTDIMEPKGSGYTGRHGEDFLSANDQAWIGFSVEIGPAGAVYILDWHDQDICGHSIRFPDTARVYRIFPKSGKVDPTPDLRKMSDTELAKMQGHRNEWFVRHARTILHERTINGTLGADEVYQQLYRVFDDADTTGTRLRAFWALHVTGGLTLDNEAPLLNALEHDDDMIRAWAIQLLCETQSPSRPALNQFETMARSDPSPIVRRFLASALQRTPVDVRWPILESLASRHEDADDPNIPVLLWTVLEGMTLENPERAVNLAVKSKIPALQRHVARLLAEASRRSQ